MFFSAITRNLNCESLTKNWVTFIRWDGIKMKNFDMGVWPINPVFRGRGVPKNQYIEGFA